MSRKLRSLSVVMPAYNEEAVIVDTIMKVHRYIGSVAQEFEIIVVNDGSNDGTAKKIENLRGKIANLKILEHTENKGYGEALRTGFNAARFEWVFQTDSDGQFRIDELDKFIKFTDQYDAIVGYRKQRADAWYRAFLTWIYMSLVGILFDLKIRDAGCAFKLFKKELWDKVQPIISQDHKIFLVEFMWKVQRLGVGTKELPVTHYNRVGGKPTGANLEVMWATVRQLIVLKFKHRGFFLVTAKWIKRIADNEYGRVIGAVLGIKIVIYMASMVAFALFSPVPESQPLLEFLPSIWNRGDTYNWYLPIAEYGYVSSGWEANRIVFMPVYPLLIRAVNTLIGDNYMWSAMLAANACAVAGLVIFYLLVKLDFGKKVAWWSLIALMLFPSAYFLSAAYSEGPLLLFVVGSFYLARRKRWWWSGLLGGLAALTKISSIVLWPALLVEFIIQRKAGKELWTESLLWTLLIPGGLVIYLLLNATLFGSPFAFTGFVNEVWHKQFAWPWAALLSKWNAIGGFPYSGGTIVNDIAELLAGLAFIVTTVAALFKLRFSYTVYMAGISFVYLSTSFLQSMPRYLLTAFPLFILMGVLGKNPLIRSVWLPFSISIMVLFMSQFVLGRGAF